MNDWLEVPVSIKVWGGVGTLSGPHLRRHIAMKAPPIYLIKEVTVICHNRIKASIHTKAGDIENSLIGLACTVQSYYSGGVSVEFLAYEHYGYVSDTEYLVRSIEGSDIDDFSEGWL